MLIQALTLLVSIFAPQRRRLTAAQRRDIHEAYAFLEHARQPRPRPDDAQAPRGQGASVPDLAASSRDELAARRQAKPPAHPLDPSAKARVIAFQSRLQTTKLRLAARLDVHERHQALEARFAA